MLPWTLLCGHGFPSLGYTSRSMMLWDCTPRSFTVHVPTSHAPGLPFLHICTHIILAPLITAAPEGEGVSLWSELQLPDDYCFSWRSVCSGPSPFCNWVAFFLLGSRFLNILNTSSLPDIWFANTLFYSAGFLFTFLIVFFEVQKIFMLIKSNYLLFFYCLCFQCFT